MFSGIKTNKNNIWAKRQQGQQISKIFQKLDFWKKSWNFICFQIFFESFLWGVVNLGNLYDTFTSFSCIQMKKKMKIEFCGIFALGHVFPKNQIWPQILRDLWDSNLVKNSNFYFFIMNRIWGSNWSIKDMIFTIFVFFWWKSHSVGILHRVMSEGLFFVLAHPCWELKKHILRRKQICSSWNFFCVYSKVFLVLRKNIDEFWVCCAYS